MARFAFDPVPEVSPIGAPGGDYQHIEATPEMFGGLIARSAERLGQGVESAGEAGLGYLTEKQNLNNQIHASQLHSWFTDQATDLVTKYSQLQGQSALNALPKFKQDLQNLQQQAEAQAGSDQARTMVATNTRRSMDWFYGIGTRHADTQHTAWATQTAHDNITAAIGVGGLAVQNLDQNKTDEEMRRIDIEAHNYYDPQGYDPQTLGVQVSKYRGQALKNWVETAATNDKDPDALTHAQQLYNRYGASVDPDSRLAISKFLNTRNHNRTVENITDIMMAPSGRTVAPGISPERRGLLDTIRQGETVHGGYDELYTGRSIGQVRPDFDYSEHPRVFFPIEHGPHAGEKTSAFGPYQITATTWDQDKGRYGLSDITPQSQDQWALHKTQELYSRAYRGPLFRGFQGLSGDLDEDLKFHSQDPAFLNALGHTMSGEWTSAPGGIEPNAATGSWVARFQKNIAANRGEPAGMPDSGEVAARIMQDPAFIGRPELQREVLQRAMGRISLMERAQTLQQKQQKEASDAAEHDLFFRIHGNDPSKLPTLDEIRDNPNLSMAASKELTHQLLAVSEGKIAKIDGPDFTETYLRIHAPDTDPRHISDPNEIYAMVRDGKLTVAGADKLVGQLHKMGTDDGRRIAELERSFFLEQKRYISGANEEFHTKDIRGDHLFAQFQLNVLKQLEEWQKANPGKSPFELFDDKNPNYLGKMVDHYRRPMSEWNNDIINDNPEATKGTPGARPELPFDINSIKTVDDAIRAFKAGQITQQQRDDLAVERGWARRRPAPPPAPPEQTVPMSQ